MKNRSKVVGTMLVVTVLVSQILSGCNATNTTKGGAIGAGAGAAIGGVIGYKTGNTAAGAIIGAAVGGTTGALIGRHMDKQAEELQADLKGAKVERIGEGILITFDSGLLFKLNSSTLSATTQANLADLSRTVNKYDDTNLLIEGHTDSSGEVAYNNKLSDQRAHAVATFMSGQSVKSSRITTKGYGESQPISNNETEAGRQENRRVEVAIYANKEMKKAAEKGQLGAI